MFHKACTYHKKITTLSEKLLYPLVDLSMRLYIANIFFKSGKLRLNDFLNGQWDNQVTAFTDYHPVPGIPPELAAIAGTGAEVILPILLAFGLFTRLGAAGLLVMTLTIQFLVPADYGVANDDHYMWMMLLAVPMLKGASTLSLDALGKKFCCKSRLCKKDA